MLTAGQRPGFKTTQASSHVILLAWRTLALIVCLKEGRREQGRRNFQSFKSLKEMFLASKLEPMYHRSVYSRGLACA